MLIDEATHFEIYQLVLVDSEALLCICDNYITMQPARLLAESVFHVWA